MTEPVTVLGLGPMGHAIAEAFVRAGHPTTVWNRSAGRPVPEGATLVPELADAVSASAIVVVCVMDYDAVRAVLEKAADALRGKHVVNLTSGAPDAARAMAVWAGEHAITYTDGAIMTPTDTIGTPGAVVLHSGADTTILTALGGEPRQLGAEPGRAAAYDVALLDIFWTSVHGVAHAFALARSENVPLADLTPLAKGIADLMPIVIDEHSARLEKNDHTDHYANLHSAAAGMSHIVETAEARGIDASVMRAAHALARKAIDAGHGGDGISRLTALLEETPPTQVRVT